jgi:hypothetical protein
MAEMKYRKLRIAWSVGWGILCVLLIMLWLRSYWQRWEQLSFVSYNGRGWYIASSPGAVTLTTALYNPAEPGEWRMHSAWEPGFLGFNKFTYRSSISLRVPFWFICVGLFACTAIPWLHWRFSLRTLLIATTLAAVCLGLLVMMLRGS